MSHFGDLHHRERRPLLLANPWDAGSARLLESLGYEALATTSSGFAATLGRLDYGVRRDEALAHAASIAAAVAVPVTADLESGFGETLEEVGETFRLAVEAGLAGGSIEDSTGSDDAPIHPPDVAADRVRAAAEAVRRTGSPFVLTARAENHLHGRDDLGDTIARLQAFESAGADVLYAPGLTRLEDIRRVVAAVDRPVNVLARPGVPPVAELAAAGVRRVSVGGAFAFAALDALAGAARELLERGTYGFLEPAGAGSERAAAAFAGR